MSDKNLLIGFVGCLMDVIWQARNKTTHGAPIPSVFELSAHLSRLFLLARSSLAPFPLPPMTSWVPPPEGWFKLNFDAVVLETGSMTIAVGRASDGLIVA